MTIVYLVNCHCLYLFWFFTVSQRANFPFSDFLDQSQVSFSISINVNAGDRSPEFGGGLTSDLCVVTTEILGYI